MNIPTNLILFILILALIVFVQVKLSKKENSKLGLIFPAFTLFISIIGVLNVYVPDDKIISTVPYLFSIFLYLNIPTIILVGIYLYCKNDNKKNMEIEKMKINDLK